MFLPSCPGTRRGWGSVRQMHAEPDTNAGCDGRRHTMDAVIVPAQRANADDLRAFAVHGHREGARDAVQGEPPRNGLRLASAHEPHGGKSAHIEHIGRQRLAAALRIIHPQAGHLNRHIDRAGAARRRVLQHGAGKGVETGANWQKVEGEDGEGDAAAGRRQQDPPGCGRRPIDDQAKKSSQEHPHGQCAPVARRRPQP